MQLNTRTIERTHEGAPAAILSNLQQLRRSVLACLLWEDQFYESGETIAERIQTLASRCEATEVSALAIEARSSFHLRHAPLLLARELCRHPRVKDRRLIGDTVFAVIQRADELSEFLALYWKDGKIPLSKQVKFGLQRAFRKFSEYHLAKYNRDKAIKLLDVMRLVHPLPKDEEQAQLWKRLRDGELATPDTWEVALSAGADKGKTFTRLLKENKLGGLALLRNLRNMLQSGVEKSLIEHALAKANLSRILPFRFVAAARHAPSLEPLLDHCMQLAMMDLPKLHGHTVLLVDVSGSMVGTKISNKSELDRLDAAAALAVLVSGQCESSQVFTFSSVVREMPPRKGMALIDAIRHTNHDTTYLGQAINTVRSIKKDRLIVITDEQSHDPVGAPDTRGYMLNVAANKNGVGYGNWHRINGFSEAVMNYIVEFEAMA
jgi:hypothetical protein